MQILLYSKQLVLCSNPYHTENVEKIEIVLKEIKTKTILYTNLEQFQFTLIIEMFLLKSSKLYSIEIIKSKNFQKEMKIYKNT